MKDFVSLEALPGRQCNGPMPIVTRLPVGVGLIGGIKSQGRFWNVEWVPS